jgi:hypothetical protein
MSECRAAAEGQMMKRIRDHYHGYSHPVLVDLPAKPTADLFTEMDEIADEIRTNPEHIEADDEIAFRDLQRIRRPDLSKQQFRDLFAVWRDRYQARQVIDDAERAARFDSLCAERQVLFNAGALYPPERDAVTTRLIEIGRALADFMPSCPAAPLGEWVDSPSRAAP